MKFADLQFFPHHAGMGGIHAKVHFPNGYGASVISTPFSYGNEEGLLELAVLHNGELCYTTPLTSDVLGHLTEADVEKYLNEIEALEPKCPTSSEL